MSPWHPFLSLMMGCLNEMPLGGLSTGKKLSFLPRPFSSPGDVVESFLLPFCLPFVSYFVLNKMSVLRMIHEQSTFLGNKFWCSLRAWAPVSSPLEKHHKNPKSPTRPVLAWLFTLFRGSSSLLDLSAELYFSLLEVFFLMTQYFSSQTWVLWWKRQALEIDLSMHFHSILTIFDPWKSAILSFFHL